MRLLRPAALAVALAPLTLLVVPAAVRVAGAATASASASASGSAKATEGKINLKEFEAALKPHLAAIHGCYDKALKKNAVAEGEIVLRIKSKGGKVIDGGTDLAASSLKLAEAHKCIADVVKKIEMPIAKGPDKNPDPALTSEIRYPVELTLGIDVTGKGGGTTGAKLDYDKVKETFTNNRVSIGECWLAESMQGKAAAAVGRLLIKLDVAGGKVTGVGKIADQTTLKDPDLETCVYAAVKLFKFPVAKDLNGNDDEKAKSTITWPLDFKPR
jgi:hypothetical protein